MIDVNDMMAAENRRQEVAVRAGVPIRQVKAEPSIFKDLQVKFLEAFYPMEVNREFAQVMAETKFPGYNWGVTSDDIADLISSDGKIRGSVQADTRTEEEQAADMEALLVESAENELKVTRTATGAPKVDDSGNIVPPIQSETPEAAADAKRDQKQRERTREQEAKLEQAREDKPKPTQQPVVVVKEDKKDK